MKGSLKNGQFKIGKYCEKGYYEYMKRTPRRRLMSWASPSRRGRISRIHSFFMLTLAVALIHLIVLASTQIPLLQNILGYESSITVDQVYNQINAKRAEKGLGSLKLNNQLSAAAYAKAQDMLQKGYWAHTSPEGKEPWNFITENGYSYRVAGENLARNFSSTTPMIEAWQASPTHNANVSSSVYSETGIAVLQGEMDGVPTTLVVQLFAAPQEGGDRVPIAQVQGEGFLGEQGAQSTSQPKSDIRTAPETPSPSQESQKLVGPERVIDPDQEALLGTQDEWLPPDNTVKPVLSPLDLYRGGAVIALLGMGALLIHDFRQEKKRPGKYVGSKHLAHFLLLLGVVLTLVIMESGSLL